MHNKCHALHQCATHWNKLKANLRRVTCGFHACSTHQKKEELLEETKQTKERTAQKKKGIISDSSTGN